MKYTNKYNIHPVLEEAIKKEYTAEGDISVTQLIKPIRQVVLELRHQDEIEVDVSDGLWKLLGTAVHNLIASCNTKGIVEQTFVKKINGIVLSGKPDLILDGNLYDFKVTSVFSVSYAKKEWEKQLNYYYYLLTENGIEIDRMFIVAILRDWIKSKEKEDYPLLPFVQREVEKEDLAKIEKEIRTKIKAITRLKNAKRLPDCDDKWSTPSFYIIIKDGKTILKTESYKQVIGIRKKDKSITVKKIEGKNRRCDYCIVRRFCEEEKRKRERKEVKGM